MHFSHLMCLCDGRDVPAMRVYKLWFAALVVFLFCFPSVHLTFTVVAENKEEPEYEDCPIECCY